MNKTKKKILLSAIALFNKEGITNVRNQDIAQHAGISLSNFNYHFATKQDLVIDICAYMTDVLHEKVYGNKVMIHEGQGLEITKAYFEFEEEFKFFYLDTHIILRNYPELKVGLQKQIQESLQIIKNLHYMSIGKGLMKPEPKDMPGLYDQLAQQIWINNHFWFAQCIIREIEGDIIKKGLESCFSITYPYLTEEGKVSFKQFIDSLQAKKARA